MRDVLRDANHEKNTFAPGVADLDVHEHVRRHRQPGKTRDPLTVPPGEFANYLAAGILGVLANANANDFSIWMLGWNIETGANSVLKFQVDYIDEKAMSATDEAGVGYNTVFKTALSVTF